MGRGTGYNRYGEKVSVRSTRPATIQEAEYLFHITESRNDESIASKGLLTGEPIEGHTEGGLWADNYYGRRPVYLTLRPGASRHTVYAEASPHYKQTIYQIAKDSLRDLRPDLPGLIDSGAQMDEDGMYWEEGDEPEELQPYLSDGWISYEDLLNDPEIIEAAINTTGSAACLEPVKAEALEPQK